MSRNVGTFNIAANFEGLLKGPINAGQLVINYSALTSPSTWNQSGSVWLYNGAIVSVADDVDPTKNSIYYLKDADNYTMTCSWVKSGEGTLTGATNGLSLVNNGSAIALGGALTGDTYFSGYTLNYNGDYSGTYNIRSIPDVGYVNSIATGLAPKAAALVATVSGITLSGLQTIDGITLSNGDRVLVKNQAGGVTNGVYIATGSTWQRSSDFNGTPSGETVSGNYLWVLSGNTNGNTAWVLNTPDPITIGVTPLNFVLFAHVADVIAGNGMTIIQSGGTHIVSLGGALTCNTALTGAYTLNVCNGAKLNTTCGYQISGVTMFRTANPTLSSIYLGQFAGSNGTGANNVGIGYQTLQSNTTGGDNIAIGYQTMYSNVNGGGNIANGYQALYNNIAGVYNIANGIWTLYCNTIGRENIANGISALYSNDNGCYNIAIGSNASRNNISGCTNIAIGAYALYNNNGNYNMGNGYQALYNNVYGCFNIANGICTLYDNACGCNNIAIGSCAGLLNITGNSNIFIGFNAGYNELTSNKLHIANSTLCTLIYGDFVQNFVTLPTLKICNTPAVGLTTDSFLVWNSVDKCVKQISGGTAIISANNGLTKAGSNVRLGGALTGNTIVCRNTKDISIGGTAESRLYICNNYAGLCANNNVLVEVNSGSCSANLCAGIANIKLCGAVSGESAFIEANVSYLNINGVTCNESTTLKANTDSCLDICGASGIEYANLYATNHSYLKINSLIGNEYVDLQANTNSYLGISNTHATLQANANSYLSICSLIGQEHANLYATNCSYLDIRGVSGDTHVYLQSDANTYLRLSGGTASILGTTKLLTTPATGLNTDSILVWNSTDKCIKQINGGAVLSSAITGATNGLTKTGQVVSLGGCLSSNGATFTGTSNSHLKYNGDYCSAFTARSIPDVGYVTGYTQSVANMVRVRIECTNAVEICFNDNFVGISGASCVYLNNDPPFTAGRRYTISDVCGNAFANPIEVNGNGYSIDCNATATCGNSVSLINSDYGSITFVYNGKFWSSTAYMP